LNSPSLAAADDENEMDGEVDGYSQYIHDADGDVDEEINP
jgi:hypothetical protein